MARPFAPGASTRRLVVDAEANTPTFGAINSEIGAAAGPVRRRASYYARNNPWIANGVNALVSGAVGAGIVPQISASRPRRVRGDPSRLARVDQRPPTRHGVTDAYGLMALAVRSMTQRTARRLRPARTQRSTGCASDFSARKCARSTRRASSRGRATHLAGHRARRRWLARGVLAASRREPDVPSFSTELVRMPAEQMAHLFQPISPGQLRGVSALAPILLRLHELDVYEDSQLVRQKVSACFAVSSPTRPASGVFSGEHWIRPACCASDSSPAR